MTPYQAMVREFNIAIGCERGTEEERAKGPAIRAPELRARLIEEEVRETVEAIERGDLVETVDGLCDVLYVTYGAADVFGIELEVGRWSTTAKHGQLLSYRARQLQNWCNLGCEAIRVADVVPAEAGLRRLADCTWEIAARGLGLYLDPFFAEVHRTNMAKVGGDVDKHGKRLKPPGWQPPRIAEMLREMGRIP